jgi:spermidine dehydrogenase
MAHESDSVDRTTIPLTSEERELGMGRDITRRDFLNAAALGTGATLLGTSAPSLVRAMRMDGMDSTSAGSHPWTGYAGVGDYSRSNGNTWDVVSAGHGIRDHQYEKAIADATVTGETHDLVIIGGGYAGIVAAYTFLKATQRKSSCLILENHPIMGGEAKRNEFLVDGQRLIGPQGSNAGGTAPAGNDWLGDMARDIGMPTAFECARLPPDRKKMEFPGDNYMYLLWADQFENNGFYFDAPRPHWVTDPWGRGLEGTPWPTEVRRDLLRCRDEPMEPFKGDETGLQRWLDTMTYDEFLTNVRGLHREVGRYLDPMTASGLGLGADVINANAAYYFSYPGFQGLSKEPTRILIPGRKLANSHRPSSFPGGNDGTMRALLKWLNPAIIDGSTAFPEIYHGAFRYEMMDRQNDPCRMRTGATVVRVTQDPESRSAATPVTITYAKNGKLYSVQAKTVIWAGAVWSAKHAIQNVPEDSRMAMESFPRGSMLVANVALKNWRFLYKLGYTACSWRGGFGYTCNMVAPMYVGDYRPRLDPDSPMILSFYVPFNERGPSLADQGRIGRQKLLGTTYRDYETQIRRQMVRLFSDAGFDPGRDIAGIVLNRWGHAYVTAGPGFFYGRDGRPAPSDVLRRGMGKLTFAHSELSGHQNSGAASREGKRAAEQVLAML